VIRRRLDQLGRLVERVLAAVWPAETRLIDTPPGQTDRERIQTLVDRAATRNTPKGTTP